MIRMIVFVLLWVAGPVFAGADCKLCARLKERLQSQAALKAQTLELLGKNNRYLETLSAAEASKHLKVKSNVIEVLKKLDEIKQETTRAELSFEQNGCTDCLTGTSEPGKAGPS